MQDMDQQKEKPSGAAAAAVVAGGLGSFAIGLGATLSQAYPKIKNLLDWYAPVGPLSGETAVGLALWLASWAVLHAMWKERELTFKFLMQHSNL